ncbi:MAG: hypothetical protein ACLFQM_13535 [Fidelibacterota bacterium]
MRQLLIILVILPVFLFAETPVMVETALNKLAADSTNQYSYTKKTRSAERTRVIKYDPTEKGSDRWELISIDGQQPTKEELKSFYEEKAKNEEKNGRSFSVDSDEMRDFTLISETGDMIKYSYRVESEKNKKMTEKLRCEMAINKKDTSLAEIKMEITEPFSPMVSVKLEEFHVEMKFDRYQPTGSPVMAQTKTRIRGKAMLFKKIDQNVTEKYYDYQLVKKAAK